MACNSPLRMTRMQNGKLRAGHLPLLSGEPGLMAMEHLVFPCGKCMGCRLHRKREWVIRARHEMTLHKNTAFVTLTYANEHLPPFGSLSKGDLSAFLKRYRKVLSWRGISNVRFLACGEYGDKTLRPHYHLLLFGGFPPDAKYFAHRAGVALYTSELLLDAWGKGIVDLSLAESSKVPGYIASYITKKAFGETSETRYTRVNPDTGELVAVEPEFQRQSNRPGLGAGWYEKYGEQTHTHDNVIHNEKPVPVPRFYDKLLEKKNPERLEELKILRVFRANQSKLRQPLEYTIPRMQTKERCNVLNYIESRKKRTI